MSAESEPPAMREIDVLRLPDDEFKDELRRRLAEIYTPKGIEIWMTARHQQFGGFTVDELLMTNRRTLPLDVIDQLASGAFA